MPDDVKVPSEEEIAQLPKWARVAFAARCAERVLPLFGRGVSRDSSRTVIRRAVASAIECAQLATPYSEPSEGTDPIELAEAAYRAQKAGEDYARDPYKPKPDGTMPPLEDPGTLEDAQQAGQRALKAGEAGNAALLAAAAVAVARGDIRSPKTFRETLQKAAWTAPVAHAVRRDLDTLLAVARAGNWDDGTPVPQSVFGPMWPAETPYWWPEDESERDPRFRLTLDMPEDADPKEFARDVKRLTSLLSKLQVMSGGSGLEVEDWRLLEQVEEPAPEPTGHV